MAYWTKRVVCGALLLGVLGFSGVAGAADYTYTGDPAQLQTDPHTPFKVLFPGDIATTGASGNTLTINYFSSEEWNDPLNPYRAYGGFTEQGDASNNRVTFVKGYIGHDVYGGYTVAGNASGNTITLKGGVGASALGGLTEKGDASGNTVVLRGGYAKGSLVGGRTKNGSAYDNTVIMYDNDPRHNQILLGGETYEGGEAFNNSVSVYGGQIVTLTGGMSAVAAYNNTVTISGSPTFNSYGAIHGGLPFYGSPGKVYGNTLNVWEYSGTVGTKSVSNVQYYNFRLNAASQPLRVTGTGADAGLKLGDTENADSTVTGISFSRGYKPKAGDTFTLLSSTEPITGGITNLGQMDVAQGVVMLYSGMLELDTNALTYTVTDDGRINPRAKALAEGRVANTAFINQGGDLAAGQGMMAARNAGSGLQAFAAGSMGKSRYNTGSHVDVQGLSFLAGVAWNSAIEPGNVTLGAFFEAGSGSYDSHNSFSNASVKGDGDTNYYGGGILGRMEINAGPGALYAEASGRMGRSDTDFSSSDISDGIKASYDSDSRYYGAHAGLGYIWNITEAGSLDLYTKYFWTRQASDTVTLSSGDRVKFKTATSSRARAGARYSHKLVKENTTVVSPYIGAAFEREFDGKARASSLGQNFDSPTLRGNTGMGEIGVTVKTATTGILSGVSLDFGLQGYTGRREGVAGSLQLKFEF